VTGHEAAGPEAGGLADLVAALGGDIPADLAERAVTHRSFAYENGGLPTNERLEFLGDAVLGLVVTEELYLRYPELPEGQLAKLRAAVVNSRALAGVARGLGVGDYLRLGRGEQGSGGRDKSSILADALEALIGALYLARGAEVTRAWVLDAFAGLLDEAAKLGAGLDWKTSLQELAAGRALGVPEYDVAEAGPDHAKTFTAIAVVGGQQVGAGEGRSKKEAEQRAAEVAWTALSAGDETDAADADTGHG